MKVWIRNLTKDTEMELELPMEEQELDKAINPKDEYIIIDSEVLEVGEYNSIDELNDFLVGCRQNGISEEELEVLSKAMFYHEIIEAVRERSYCIIDFDAETSDWCFGHGGDITSDFDKGMCLFDSGFYNPFQFKMTDAIHVWIDWAAVWRDAETSGWMMARVNNNGYLVHK
jgi:hypothetical protein